MSIDHTEFDQLQDTLINSENTFCGSFIYPFGVLFDPFGREFWQENFISPYNTYYGTNHTYEKLEPIPLFLLHTFIMPSWFFKHIMEFVESNLPQLLRGLHWETRHLAGTLERVFALCISCGIIEGKLKNIMALKGIKNIGEQRLQDSFRGIK